MRRAQRLRPDFALTPDDSDAVVRICHAVQGLPLGIKLAAAWVRQLTCAEIAGEIERNLGFLATTQRDVPPRQRSLRAVFDWSWRRLSFDEQAVFQRLAVFQGPFSREAAVQVADASLPILAALADKSLVWHRGTAYQLHEVARHFAGEKLRLAGAEGDAQTGHARYYAGLLARNKLRLEGQDQKTALEEIEREIDNVRAAWQWLAAWRDVAGIEAATSGFYPFVVIRSRFREGLEAFHTARLALEQMPATDRMAQLVYNRVKAREGRFRSALAQHDQALILLGEALAALRILDAPEEVAFVLGHMGGIARAQGDLDVAEERLQECLALRQATGGLYGQAIAWLELGGIAFVRGDYAATRLRCQEGLTIAERAGDLQTTAHLLTGLSLSHRELGNYAEAQAFGRRSLAIYEELGDNYGLLQAFLTLGELSRQLGDHEAARRFCARAVLVSQEIGDRSGEADGHYRLGQIAAGVGERDEALRQLRQALGLAHEIHETPLVLNILLELACLLAESGDATNAATILVFLRQQPQLPEPYRQRADDALNQLAMSAATWSDVASSLDEIVAGICQQV